MEPGEQDNVLGAAKDQIQIEYYPDTIIVNGAQLPEPKAQTYVQLLKSYKLAPYSNRRILLEDKYIIIGDFNENLKFTRGTIYNKAKNWKQSGVKLNDFEKNLSV